MRFILAALLILPTIAFAEETKTIKIGWIGPLTGNAAFLGTDSAAIVRNAFDEVNAKGGVSGRKIELLIEDDRYETAQTVLAYQRMVKQHKPVAVFVLTYGGLLAVSRYAEKDNVLILDTLDCDDEIAALPKNIFCIAKKTEDMGIKNAKQCIRGECAPVGIIYYAGDPFPVKVAEATKKEFEKKGTPLALYEGVDQFGKDFRSILTKAKDQKLKSLFLYGYEDFGVAAKQAKEIGLNAQLYSMSSIDSEGFRKSSGDTIDKALVTSWYAPRTEKFKNFTDNFKKQNGRDIAFEICAVPTYDATQLLIAAFNSGASDTTALRDYLYLVKNFDGLSGKITIDSDGAVRSLPVEMYQYSYQTREFKPVG